MNITIRIPGTDAWTSSTQHITPSMRDAYANYKEYPRNYILFREKPYVSDEWIVYRPDNDPYLPTYIARLTNASEVNFPEINHQFITKDIHETMESNQMTIPIMDLNDVYVFLTDHRSNQPAWIPARSYQIWAYRDYVYDHNRSIKKSYMTRGTSPFVYENDDHMLVNQMVTINLADLDPNIVFNIARHHNNSVYYEKNNDFRTRVRICDSDFARTGYLGFYTRLTMDPGVIIIQPQNLHSVSHLPEVEETNDEEHQCILCVKYRINVRFSPCEHQVCCSDCYSKLSKNECPLCRTEITQIMNT